MLSLATGIILFVVFYQRRVIIHQQQLKHITEEKEKELTQAAISAEEEERNRIAAELHDDVGVMLASVRLYLLMAAGQGPSGKAFGQSRQLIDETIQKVRNLSRSLQPALMEHLGLISALHAFFDIFNNSPVIKIYYHEGELPELSENAALAIYRIMQELVNNTLKHANATEIWVNHTIANNMLLLRFTHNGNGITEENFQEYIYKKDAMGLKNIINRLKILNGNISFDSDTHHHTIMKIPL
jgi:signal transduction histidine kinase